MKQGRICILMTKAVIEVGITGTGNTDQQEKQLISGKRK
jgi:hypothetical protein